LELSSEDIVCVLGVSAGTAEQWESGETPIPTETRAMLTRADNALSRLLAIFRPERLPQAISQKADLFQGDSARDWICQGRIQEVADLYDANVSLPGMTATVVHEHLPIFRVVRRGWPDAADTRFSQLSDVNIDGIRRAFRRFIAVAPRLWPVPSFGIFCLMEASRRFAGVDLTDLQETAQPQLVEINRSGEPIDMVSEAAIAVAGFSRDYPIGSRHSETQRIATKWHKDGGVGVLCRSASLARLGYTDWTGDHAPWSELAIYTDNSTIRPSVMKRRDDLTWFIPVPEQSPRSGGGVRDAT
jgi:transcriptional regulator with XRE-family HTH domain